MGCPLGETALFLSIARVQRTVRDRCFAGAAMAVALWASALMAPPSARASTFQLGTVTATSQQPTTCPSGFQCSGYAVSGCPAVSADINAYIASAAPTAPARGLAVFFSGDLGTSWWGADLPSLADFLSSLRQAGMETVEVQWSSAWMTGSA